VTKAVIIDASPLIFLSRSQHLSLLEIFADEVWIPEPVATEIQQRGSEDISVQMIKDTDWLVEKPVSVIPIMVAEWRLGAGESGVLGLALEHGMEAIIDDLAGRKCAASLGVLVRGTLGIVLAAKQRGVISQARPVIEDMIDAGLYLSKSVLNKALQKVGE
jgi:predicted nucleic acid-binding protein